MFVVVVFFEIKPERVEAFREAIVRQARRCLELEPGCRQFDVSQDPTDPASFFLYEVYDDEKAFAAHRAATHVSEFGALIKDWVGSRKLLTFNRISALSTKLN